MGTSNAMKNAMLDAGGTFATWCSLHTADPGTTGANEVAGISRVQTTWGAATGGSKTGSAVTITIPASGGTTIITHFSIWTASTAGTFATSGTLTVAETYSSAGGTYVLTPVLAE